LIDSIELVDFRRDFFSCAFETGLLRGKNDLPEEEYSFKVCVVLQTTSFVKNQ
jgi:hypothetical protein